MFSASKAHHSFVACSLLIGQSDFTFSVIMLSRCALEIVECFLIVSQLCFCCCCHRRQLLVPFAAAASVDVVIIVVVVEVVVVAAKFHSLQCFGCYIVGCCPCRCCP